MLTRSSQFARLAHNLKIVWLATHRLVFWNPSLFSYWFLFVFRSLMTEFEIKGNLFLRTIYFIIQTPLIHAISHHTIHCRRLFFLMQERNCWLFGVYAKSFLWHVRHVNFFSMCGTYIFLTRTSRQILGT